MKAAEKKATEYVTKLYKNVPILDSGARGSTTTFVKRGLGDVLLAWENEALLAVNKLSKGEFDIVVPSISILAEPPVTVVNGNVENKGAAAVEAAEAYLNTSTRRWPRSWPPSITTARCSSTLLTRKA